LRPGESVAIVGRTGSGKTTLLNLIARLYEPTEGSILVGGVPAERWPRGAYRRGFGIVPQETFLFSQTIRENIAFGRDDGANGTPHADRGSAPSADGASTATPDVQLELAAGRAALDSDLSQFPHGLDTMLGERGITLSGG